MGGLGIEDITIGYSSTGAAKYIHDLNTTAIIETNGIITDQTDVIKDVLQQGWQGSACDAFCAKLTEAAEGLKDKLKEMEEIFNVTLAAQEETYHQEDHGMADEISGQSIF